MFVGGEFGNLHDALFSVHEDPKHQLGELTSDFVFVLYTRQL